MTTLLVFLALGQSGALPTGAQAVERVKSVLGACGVPKPLRLQGLATSYNPGNDFTHVQLTDPRGRPYEAYLRRDGLQLWRGKEGHYLTGHQPKADTSSAAKAKMDRWVKGLGVREPLRLTALTIDEKGFRQGEYAILRNGYPFVVSWQFYGYRFTADQKGELVAMSASENPPPVQPADPVLNEQAARSRLEEIYKALQPTNRDTRYTYRIAGPLALGYFLPKDAARARLVWRIPLMSMTHTAFGSRGGSNAILIDAVSGEQIKTDVVP